MRYRNLILAFLILALFTSGFLLFKETGRNMTYYYEVDEIQAPPAHRVKISGIVRAGTLVKDPAEKRIRFIISGQRQSYPVEYSGALPDIFREGIQVVVTGRFDTEGVFHASELLAKCPSKYLPQGSRADFSGSSLNSPPLPLPSRAP